MSIPAGGVLGGDGDDALAAERVVEEALDVEASRMTIHPASRTHDRAMYPAVTRSTLGLHVVQDADLQDRVFGLITRVG